MKSTNEKICSTCGHIGPSKTVTKGHLLLEIALWLMMLVPGVCYSIWRLTTRHQACAKCGSATLIPADSPRGKQMMADYGHPPPDAKPATAAYAAGKLLGENLRKAPKEPLNKIPFGKF